jgi:hypothetical protein
MEFCRKADGLFPFPSSTSGFGPSTLISCMKNTPVSVKKMLVIAAVFAVLLIGGTFVWQAFEGRPEESAPAAPRELGALGELGSVCGGSARLPCNPGLVCDIGGGEYGVDEGRCVKDERDQAELMAEGEPCDQKTRACGPGLMCDIPEGAEEGTCMQAAPFTRPFIMSVIPEGMELISGAYRADPGSKITVRVHAVNVERGEMYLKPLEVSHAGVLEEEKVADLEAAVAPDEYTASFTVEEDLGANLIVVMRNGEGEEAQVSIHVASSEMIGSE